jgi:hypothetical protein
VQKFVSGFGGDPNNVTAFGESAGSGSIGFHMCADVPVFRCAMMLAGNPAIIPPYVQPRLPRLLSPVKFSSSIGVQKIEYSKAFRIYFITDSHFTRLPLQVKELEYLELLDHCGIDKGSPERLELLKNVPIEKIVELAQTKPMMPMVQDGDFWPVIPTADNAIELVGKCGWVDSIIISDSFLEVRPPATRPF